MVAEVHLVASPQVCTSAISGFHCSRWCFLGHHSKSAIDVITSSDMHKVLPLIGIKASLCEAHAAHADTKGPDSHHIHNQVNQVLMGKVTCEGRNDWLQPLGW